MACTVVIHLPQIRYYAPLYTVHVKFEFKFKILGQNWVYDEDLRLLTLKRKKLAQQCSFQKIWKILLSLGPTLKALILENVL